MKKAIAALAINFVYIKRNPYLCNEISIIITNH